LQYLCFPSSLFATSVFQRNSDIFLLLLLLHTRPSSSVRTSPCLAALLARPTRRRFARYAR
jgi:hypothetical protein